MAKEKINPIIDASFIVDNPKKIISVSPAIDIGLSGKIGRGIPEGSWILLSGSEKLGKTALSLQIAANFQQTLNKKVYYGNVEHRIKARDLTTHNLDLSPEKLQIIQSQKGHILSAEDHLQTYMDLLREEPNIVLIIDSGSALCSQDEMDGGIKAAQRIQGPKLLASFCRQMQSVVPLQDSVVIIILHVIANTGRGMSTKYIDGGRKIKYQADINLEGTHFKIQSSNEDGAGYGQDVFWKVKWSALSAPGAKIQNFFRYGYGIDSERELIQIGKSCGLILSGGAGWLTCEFAEEIPKLQGDEKLRNYLVENPDKTKILIEKINEML